MVYLIIGMILAVWFAIAGVIRVLKPRLMFYLNIFPIFLLLQVGFWAGMVDEQLGYEHDYWAYAGIANGIDFYIFLFMKNWALSIFVICSAFLSYEIAKFVTRRYKPKLKRKRETTAEYMQNLP